VQKMSKSLGNYISITESPREMFGKVMSISDELMWRYYELLTDLEAREVSEMKESGENPRDLKADLGRRIVTDFHSAAAAWEASEEFYRMFRERQLPSDIAQIQRAPGPVRLARLIAQEGLAGSVSEAQRLITQGSVRVDGERVSDVKNEITGSPDSETLIQVGKRKFLKIRFS